MSIDDDWDSFNMNDIINDTENENENENENGNDILRQEVTSKIECSPLKISTKTKIVYLNKTIELEEVFWKIPLIKYMNLSNGVIKKQIKIQTNSNDDFIKLIQNKDRFSDYILTENILYDSTTVTARQDNFKDIRKISIGLSKKDITTYRSKEKSAFYNCFVIIVRTLFGDEYKEVHVKIFNTGKMEIPGVHNDVLFENVKREIIRTLQPYFTDEIYFKDELCITVLINSNFNAGFSIKRCQLYNILRMKYNISACYDPCSYPGVQCKYNFEETNTTISFMVFRTGSVLIVGKCSDEQLYNVYNFLVKVFSDEYESIKDNYILPVKDMNKKKKKKKKTIIISSNV
jgi:TATA-box binding protein (TBP) (component of TFIID and TFIIIB)